MGKPFEWVRYDVDEFSPHGGTENVQRDGSWDPVRGSVDILQGAVESRIRHVHTEKAYNPAQLSREMFLKVLVEDHVNFRVTPERLYDDMESFGRAVLGKFVPF